MSTRSSTRNLFPPIENPELTIRRRTRVDPNLLKDFNMATNRKGDNQPPPEGGDLPVPDLRTMEELCQPTLNGQGGPIAPIAIQAANFRLKNDMIQQVKNSCQFHKLSGDDANKHLDKFLHVTQSIKVNGVTDDALRLYLFSHSLTHHATAWFDCFPRNSITTFEQMAKMFLGKYFPPSMVKKLRNKITNFCQRPNESLFKAWERYKLSIDRCPNHNMLPVTQIDTFYNGLTLRHRDTINADVSETFMKRRPEECYDLIENMTANHNDWDTSSGSESRPPMLNKENYVPWSSRLLRYAKSRPNGKLIHNSIINGPYVRRMIPEPGDTNREVPVNETFHVQTDDELIEKELKQIEADDQAIPTILLGLLEDIYAAVDSYETTQEIWLRVQQMMKGSDIRIQEKKAKLFNEWERNKHFSEKIASNLKFLNNLQPEWSRHVTIVHQTKDLHRADYTQLYDFLKYNQKEVVQNAIQNPRVQNIRNQNGLIGVPGNPNQNLNGNGNLDAARAEGNAAGHNGNQIRSTLNHLMCMPFTDVAQVVNAARNYEILHERDDDDAERPDKRTKVQGFVWGSGLGAWGIVFIAGSGRKKEKNGVLVWAGNTATVLA
nr:reverse transcriptase domain-containing protein [Tanacetum cinerariifolium]